MPTSGGEQARRNQLCADIAPTHICLKIDAADRAAEIGRKVTGKRIFANVGLFGIGVQEPAEILKSQCCKVGGRADIGVAFWISADQPLAGKVRRILREHAVGERKGPR